MTFSFCGSPEYMSPEMLGHEGHNSKIDYYSLGAILYEMLEGLPPYYSHDKQEMF
jgi:serine/threonine protein kinase